MVRLIYFSLFNEYCFYVFFHLKFLGDLSYRTEVPRTKAFDQKAIQYSCPTYFNTIVYFLFCSGGWNENSRETDFTGNKTSQGD